MREPVATYRVQLSHAFTFRHLRALTSYLDDLGISECYCSPILTARQGSTHGYDICDHASLNPELGTRQDLEALSADLRDRGMGLIVDFVPNHMGIDARTNKWWFDVLENGASSAYARFFDIDWLPVKAELRDKVLLPILGDQYGEVLERGELQLAFKQGALLVGYYERELPINPRQSPLVLGHSIESLSESLGDEHDDLIEFRAILTALRQSPLEGTRERLAALVDRSPAIRDHITAAVVHFNGARGQRDSFDSLHALLEVQPYRLAYWRTAFDEINYRRFFDINDLAGLRMEDPRVFAATHALLLELVGQGIVSGIRIDHPDGLFDPTAYFQSLAAAIAERQPTTTTADVYVVVEKILARGERLRESWPVHGTTGYSFLNTINGLFVPPDGVSDLRRLYRQFSNYRLGTTDTIYQSKRFMMRTAMASELNVLARALSRLSEADRRVRDFTLNGLRRALVEVIACFPVYRTYVSAQGAHDEDVGAVDTAIAEARRRNPVQETSIFAFIRAALLPPPLDGADASMSAWRDRSIAFAHKFQQYTAPVLAKGIEDTAFYNDVTLLSANEVGGDLRHRARSVAEFHKENIHRLTRWPLEMTAGSTHDTKRGEDARARINVIAELSDEWRTHLLRWATINDAARARRDETVAPDRNDEWMFYQALIGAWPAETPATPVPHVASPELIERMQQFMRKALKEAKRHTSWLHENLPYEEAVQAFVQTTLGGSTAPLFLESFVPLQRRIAWFGMLGSLSQLVLRIGSPGVPDTYQGSELWNFSLVDPDNRHPVDFELRRQMLDTLASATPRQLMEQWPDGRIKLFTLTKALRFRREHRDLFLHGDYEGLTTDADDPHLIAFSRRHGRSELLVIVPRFLATMFRGHPKLPFGMERWRTASVRLPRRLAGAQLKNIFTNEVVEPVVYSDASWLMAGSAFQTWPVAMFTARG